MDDLPYRLVGGGLLMLCGESTIVKHEGHRRDRPKDEMGFLSRLEALSASVILNPVHSKMTRYEMPWKRELYSRGGRTMVSVWNGSGQHESSPPWQIYRDGKDVTGSVREMPSPVPGRPDIRIGVLDVADV